MSKAHWHIFGSRLRSKTDPQRYLKNKGFGQFYQKSRNFHTFHSTSMNFFQDPCGFPYQVHQKFFSITNIPSISCWCNARFVYKLKTIKLNQSAKMRWQTTYEVEGFPQLNTNWDLMTPEKLNAPLRAFRFRTCHRCREQSRKLYAIETSWSI